MEKFALQLHLEHVREARIEKNNADAEFNASVDRMMNRLLHEAARSMMSAHEVGKHAGLTTSQVKARMRKVGLNPSEGKTLLSKHAVKVLESNAELMSIEPSEINLMSPLAYLPAGPALEPQVSKVTSLDEEPVVHGINYWDDEIGCGEMAYEQPVLVTHDNEKITCAPCRASLVSA